MRIIITTLIVVLNFILQTTLFPYLAIQGVFPNTALIIVTSYSLLRGSKEGALVGAGTGFLMDVFFHTYIGFYTALYLLIGLIFGRSQRSFFRENYILPIIFCAIATIFYQAVLYVSSFVFQGEGNILYFLFRVLLPELVYMTIVTVPLYRVLFGINEWLEQKEKRLAQEDKAEDERRKTLSRELEWIRMSPKGRHAKGKARINAYEAMLSHESEKRAPELEIYIPAGPRLGKKVIEAVGISKALGDKELMEDVNFIIPAGAIVGIIGPNGAGKTTLFKMLVGQEKPDAGTLTIGDTVQFAYVDQQRESLTPGKTVYELISDGAETIKLGNREINARAYCSRFNFTGSDQQKKVDVLSGGERNRVHTARMLKSGANVILLDEPTNDIDVNTMRALEDGLENFAGCVLVVSHDRWFLDRIATHIMAFEGDSSVVFFDGNYSEYEEDRKKRLGKDADQPHRLKFRKLTR